MKKLLLLLVVVATAFMAYAYFYQDDPAQASWLHGMWTLSYDPDGNTKDYMEFFRDGQVDLKSTPSQSYKSCVYASKIGHVTITCEVKGKDFKIALELSPTKDRLTNSSGAYYLKM